MLARKSLVLTALVLTSCAPPSTGGFSIPPDYSVRMAPKGFHGSQIFGRIGRRDHIQYSFAFNKTAIYDLHNDDQLDWNKLPGFSDCGDLDLARNGAMWAWRWNPQSQVLELSPYSNVAGKHLSAANVTSVGVINLEKADLETFSPLTYSVAVMGAEYEFTVSGQTSAGRPISARYVLPRGCRETGHWRYFSNLYFGGTSTAPHNVVGYLKWLQP